MMEIKMPPIMGKAPNIVGTIAVEKDQFVSEGQVLANVETGKGNRPIKVGSSGRIAEILCQEGQEVKVKVLNIAEDGKIALSIKRTLPPEPRQNRGGPHGGQRGGQRGRSDAPRVWQPKAAAPQGEMSFEDMMAKFKSQSEEKISDLKRVTENRRGGGYSRRR